MPYRLKRGRITVKLIKTTTVAVAAGMLLLGGCGDKKTDAPKADATTTASAATDLTALSADEILTRATKAVHDAKSLHIKGIENGEGGEKIAIDMKQSGKNVLSRLTVNGMNVEFLVVDGVQYVRPDAKMYKTLNLKLPAAVTARLATMWMKPTAGDRVFAPMAEGMTMDNMLKPDGTVTKGETTTVDGKPAIALKSADGDLLVATTGEPLPLKLMGGKDGGAITFSEYGADFPEIKAPAASEVYNLPKTS
ncbi:uncharacterized protein ACSP50_4538 [Actinoplanes sp. SE50/110]|nr:uncharacterized protein ACSP50_4538 [Actinoplanes sp. SE50/110]